MWSFVIWLYLRRNAFYPRVRNTIIALDVIGLVGYWLYPTAPPRLTPGFGFVDVLDPTQANLRSSMVGSLTNLYAAVPSLHTAYALLIGITGYRACRHLVTKLFWAVYPVLVVLATVVDRQPLAARRRRRARLALALAWTAVSRAAARSSAASCAARPRREIRSRTAGLSTARRSAPGRVPVGQRQDRALHAGGVARRHHLAGAGLAQLARRGAGRRYQRQHGPLGREVLPRLRRHDGLGAGRAPA